MIQKKATWIKKFPKIAIRFLKACGKNTLLLQMWPHHLIASFIGALEGLVSQGKTKSKLLFHGVETTIKITMGTIREKLNQRHAQREQLWSPYAYPDDCENGNCVPIQFHQIQKGQAFALQETLEWFCNVLPVFGFNNAEIYLNLINSFCYPIFFYRTR